MSKKLENLDWNCKWVSHLGCVKGCLNYLGIDASDAWVYGASGHAFIINVHDVVCPSGPTAWNSEGMLKLVENLGCKIEGVSSHKSTADFEEKKKRVWEFTKSAIDSGFPCFGWELEIPEYYVIYGYDDDGYFFKEPKKNNPTASENKPKPWQELGESEIGVLYMFSVKPSEAKDDSTLVKEALIFALEHNSNPKKWTFPKYKTGLAAYDNWIGALEAQTADGFGVAYNAEVWSECRSLAVDFLKEAKERLAKPDLDSLFDEAVSHYEAIAGELGKIKENYPFLIFDPEHIKDAARREKAVTALKAARDTEAKGLKALEEIAANL
ncbi:hypothetical protein JXM67_07235 [candidate division WOR-3 bacterium]|nr:hypothetical protein [candidate division WOR-3 bacterium]